MRRWMTNLLDTTGPVPTTGASWASSRLATIALVVLFVVWGTLPAWSHSEVDARNRVSFQVEAKREVENDWVTARFSVVEEGKDPVAVADSVNLQMAGALAIAKRVKGMEIHSGAYVTHPIYDNGRVIRWRAQQELRVESGDVDLLSKLIGTLQSKSVLLLGINFSVKDETQAALEDELIQEALVAFRNRAGLVAQGMDAKDWSLVGISVGRFGGQPRRMQMRAQSRMMSTSEAAPPAFEAGSSDLRIQIDGSIELD